MRLNHDRGIDLYAIGVYVVLQGDTWVDLTSASFTSLTATAMAASLKLVELSLRNTHADQTLYVLLKAGGTTAVADAIPVLAGKTLDLDGLLLANSGVALTTFAIRGSPGTGTGTTGSLVCGFADAGSN